MGPKKLQSSGALVPRAPPPDSIVSHYETACVAIAAARRVDEVREISATADAIRAYAKQAKNKQIEINAAEVRIRAERRLGELMQEQDDAVGLSKGGRPKTGLVSNPVSPDPKPAPVPTLAEAGIDKNLAQRARTYAAVPEEKFEKLLTDKRERDSASVKLDPDFLAEAEAAARDIEIDRDERIALSGAFELAAENGKLVKQVATLTRRIAALNDENSSLKYREKMWKERAIAAGWKGRLDA